MLTFSSIKAKIATLSGGCLLMSAMVLVGWSLVGGRQTGDFVQQKTETLLNKNAENHLGAIANANRHAISGLNLDIALDAARGFASTFSLLAGPSSSLPPATRRTELKKILETLLRQEPTLNGTYTAIEPNALDGLDADFRGKRETGTVDTGKVPAYWTRDKSGKIGLQTLVEYDSRAQHPNGVMKGGLVHRPIGERRGM